MDTAQAFLADIQKSITNATKVANSIPRKGMNVYLDKSTMVMQTLMILVHLLTPRKLLLAQVNQVVFAMY